MSTNQDNFIAHEVEQWANRVSEAVLRALERKKIGVTDELRQSIRHKSRQNIGELMFKEYGRFVDMGTGRGSKMGIESIASNRAKLTGRKPKKFYSKVSYGTLSSLIQALVSNYQETIIYQAKNKMDER